MLRMYLQNRSTNSNLIKRLLKKIRCQLLTIVIIYMLVLLYMKLICLCVFCPDGFVTLR